MVTLAVIEEVSLRIQHVLHPQTFRRVNSALFSAEWNGSLYNFPIRQCASDSLYIRLAFSIFTRFIEKVQEKVGSLVSAMGGHMHSFVCMTAIQKKGFQGGLWPWDAKPFIQLWALIYVLANQGNHSFIHVSLLGCLSHAVACLCLSGYVFWHFNSIHTVPNLQ